MEKSEVATRGAMPHDHRRIDTESRRSAREELDVNLLVEAGAGSGKTQTLAERMAAGVARGVYAIDRMAAVTFTRKAGSELRGRFHLALERERMGADALDETTERDERLGRIDEALSNLERFFAGTIHSFCARLLRERPVEAGVSPGFTELDEVQDIELRRRVWRDYVTARRAAGDPQVLELLAAGVRPRDLDAGFATMCLYEDVEFPAGDGQPPPTDEAKMGLLEFWRALERHLPVVINPETTCPVQKAARDLRALLRSAPARLDRPDVLADVLGSWDFESKITQMYWASSTAEKQRFKALIVPMHQAFREHVVTPWLTQWRQYVYRLAVTLLARAREHAAAERRRLNTLNYSDLLILTANVLRRNADVRHALQQKYRHLFVDEFQDTDPVQAEIVFLLAADEPVSPEPVRRPAAASRPQRRRKSSAPLLDAIDAAADTVDDVTSPRAAAATGVTPAGPDAPPAGEDGRPSTNWRAIPLRPGALFVVGDPKQSIYRFRRADIDIYNIVRERLGACGKVLPLTRNFRSVAPLCDWANEVFRSVFPEEPTQHAPKFAALVPTDPPRPGARDGSVARPASSPHRVQEVSDAKAGLFILSYQGRKDDAAAADATRIAAYIRSEVDAGRRRFKDFLILTRRKKDRIAPYARALEALDIPVEVSGAGAFGDSAEVAALAALLRALADPQDQLALVAVLRGPLFGISDPELFAHRRSGGPFSIFDEPRRADGDATPPSDRVSAAVAALHEYQRLTRMLPAGAALERILESTGYLALASTTPGGVEAGDLLHAVDRVRQVVEDGGSLADAADALEDAGAESNEVESLPLEPGRADVVRVMNLHKAKGLEADVVFLADPCGGVQGGRVDVHVRRDGDRAFGWFKLLARNEGSFAVRELGEHADWPRHEAAELPYLAAEEHRLLYVAATRARHMLVISRWTGNGGTPAWGLLDRFLGEAQELPVPAAVAAPEPAPADTASALESAFATHVETALAATRAPSWSTAAVTAETRHIAKITRSADATTDDPTRVVSTDTAAHRADAGMAWGTLMHGLLEHAMRFPAATPDDLRRLGLWLTVEEPQLRRSLDEAVESVLRVAKAPFWVEAKAGAHYEEVPFVHALRQEEGGRGTEAGGLARDAGPALVNGVIDLLYDSRAGWRVRDYKTDVSLQPEAYAAQLKAYRQAVEAVGERVADAELVHVRDMSDSD